MRATSFSTAAICSLGVLAAYGISNRVNSSPQPEPEKPPAPAAAAKLPIAPSISEAIAPPETMPQPLSNKRSLAQARQQREAQLSKSLAQVSALVPVPSVPSIGTTQLPSVKTLPIEQIVAQSVGSAKPLPPAVTVQLPRKSQPQIRPVIQPDAQTVARSVAQPIVQQAVQPTPTPNVAAAPAAPAVPPPATPAPATAPVARLMASALDAATQVKSAIPAVETPKPPPRSAQSDVTAAVPVASPASTPSVSPAPAESAPQAITQMAAQVVAQTTQTNSPAHAQTQAQANPQVNLQVTAPAIPQQFFTNPTNAPGVDEAYTLGPGDQLSLSFFNVPEYNGTQQVLADGTLNLPLVGAVPVTGLTLQQAEAIIANRYQSELRYAVVTASLAQTRPMQVAIVGEVQKPGSYQLASTGGFPGLVQAIQTAGGTTQAADLRAVQVLRPTPSNPSQIIAVNLVDLLQGNLSQDLKLRDGDRILVPTASSVDFAEAPQFAASNFAAAPAAVNIAVVGEVNRPGSYKLGGEGSGITVSQAIQEAGGIKPSANLRQIQIRRSTRSGAEQVIDLDFWQLLQTGNLNQDITLQQGDRITIPTASAPTNAETRLLSAANLSPETIQVNVVGEVKSGGSVKVPSGSSLNQAILAAGGPNNRATREIELIRLEPNGALSRRTILVDMTQGFNTSENPLILNNDIVVVGRSGAAQFSDQLGQINSVVGPLLQLIPFRLPMPF
jgi:polysaccharide biosynthesis/export protein